MIDERYAQLGELAERDATVAPLVLMQLEALRAADDPAWGDGVPAFGTRPLTDGRPLLHGATVGVDGVMLAALWQRLSARVEKSPQATEHPLRDILGEDGFDPMAILAGSLSGDSDRLARTANRLGVEPGVFATTAHLTVLPLLHACGQRAAAVVSAVSWRAGHCPVCGAWPTLAETRGLERERWLRCGRCGTGWPFRRLVCTFCGNDDLRAQQYFAAEGERESRRAEVCERCHAYLKSVATLGPLSLADVLAQDVATVEIDLVALDQGYVRPAQMGYPVEVQVEPVRRGHAWVPGSR
jgi:FdhE protein